jgi:hypothetical protein
MTFEISKANYAKLLNVCLGVAIISVLSPRVLPVPDILSLGVACAAGAVALYAYFFSSLSDESDQTSLVNKSEENPLKHSGSVSAALMSGRHFEEYENYYGSSLRQLDTLIKNRDVAHHLFYTLSSDKQFHSNIPQTEKLRQFVESHGRDMTEIYLGVVTIVCKGADTELRVTSPKKFFARDRLPDWVEKIEPRIPRSTYLIN